MHPPPMIIYFHRLASSVFRQHANLPMSGNAGSKCLIILASGAKGSDILRASSDEGSLLGFLKSNLCSKKNSRKDVLKRNPTLFDCLSERSLKLSVCLG